MEPFGIDATQFRRSDETRLREILVPGRLRLPIPERFVFDLARGQFADAFEAQHGMAQIGNRLVPILEVITLQKILRIMRADPIDGLADRIGRAAVPGESIGALFRRHWRDCDDSFRQTAMITVCFEYASRDFTKTR